MTQRPTEAWQSADYPSQRRRQFLAVGATLGTSALAGCSRQVMDAIGERLLDDVVVINAGQRRVAGTITVVGPDGETVLSGQFDVPPDAENGGSESEDGNSAVWGDVLTTDGTYEVMVELEAALGDVQMATDTASVADTDEEHIVVILGDSGLPSPVYVTVIESFTDLAEERDAVGNDSQSTSPEATRWEP